MEEVAHMLALHCRDNVGKFIFENFNISLKKTCNGYKCVFLRSFFLKINYKSRVDYTLMRALTHARI